jgi:TRAP-type mannitol/chloroaromatic compound transport system permease small subunit
MPKPIKAFVSWVEKTNTVVGKFAMYLVFLMIGILMFESISRAGFNRPHIWAVELAQFTMAAYYILGGGYSDILDGHVRMDLLYGRWSVKRRAWVDLFTGPVMIFYLVTLLIGAISSTHYALEYGQKNYTPWAPPLAPIKIIMCIGITLMLLQAVAVWFKDLSFLVWEKKS